MPARLCIFSVFIFIFVGKYRNMAQHTYDEESVQELLGWAKKMLETKSYPTEKYQLNSCTSIIDGKLYLESLISMISRNWENPTFIPPLSNCGNTEKSGKVKRNNECEFWAPFDKRNALRSRLFRVHYEYYKLEVSPMSGAGA